MITIDDDTRTDAKTKDKVESKLKLDKTNIKIKPDKYNAEGKTSLFSENTQQVV